jgi:hypothetical protein
VRHSRAFSRHRSAIIHYRDGYTQPITEKRKRSAGCLLFVIPQRSEGICFDVFYPRSEIVILSATENLLFVLATASSITLVAVQVLAVILSAAKDPDELDAPLSLEPFINNF